MRNARRSIWALIALVGAFWGCTDKGPEPEPVTYNIYIGATYYRDSTAAESRLAQIYAYDADSLTLRDSIVVPTQALDMDISADGRSFYAVLSSWGPVQPQTVCIDAATGETVWWTGRVGVPVRLLKGEQVLLVGECPTYLLDAATGDFIMDLDTSFCWFNGPRSGTVVAAAQNDGSFVVHAVDVLSGAVSGNYTPRTTAGYLIEPWTAVLHPDGKRVLVLGPVANRPLEYSWFLVGDLTTGQTLFEDRFYSPYGEIVLSGDQKMAAVTEKGYDIPESGPRSVRIYDLAAMTRLKLLDHSSDLVEFSTAQARFLPGDRRLVTAPPAWGFSSGGPLCLVDLVSMTVTDSIWLPTSNPIAGTSPLTGALGVGVRP